MPVPVWMRVRKTTIAVPVIDLMNFFLPSAIEILITNPIKVVTKH